MKKLIALLIVVASFLFPQITQASQPLTSDPLIFNDFRSNIVLKKDTNLLVTEVLEVEYFQPMHGIYRIIPVTYSARGRTIKARFNLLSVKDEDGDSYKYTETRLNQSIKLKIGDPEKEIRGEHTYVITYEISDVVKRFSDHDEIYWNVTGHEWNNNGILAVRAQVSSNHAKITKIDCFAGTYGKDEKECTSMYSDNLASFVATTQLGSGKDFTIVIALDKENSLSFPSRLEMIAKIVSDNWDYIPAMIPLIVIFLIWNKKGRDKKYAEGGVYYTPDDKTEKTKPLFAREHLPMVYHPIQGLTPSQVGTIIDEKVDIADIIGEMLELARLGFITIRKIKVKKTVGKTVEYAFIKTKKTNDKKEFGKLADYQSYILKELFRPTSVHKSVTEAEKLFKNKPKELDEARKALANKEYVLLSGLKNHFYEGLPEIKKRLYKNMADEKMFDGNPEKTRQKWLVLFIILVALSSISRAFFISQTGNIGPLILSIITIIPGIALAVSMPRKTAKGYALHRQIEGLKFYLKKGKWRHEIYEKHLFLEEVLPLAISLGVVNKLAKDMAGLGVEPPSYIAGMTPRGFMTDIKGFSSSTAVTLVSAPGGSWSGSSSWSGGSGFSGSGGFSGGGFGGGGGGGW